MFLERLGLDLDGGDSAAKREAELAMARDAAARDKSMDLPETIAVQRLLAADAFVRDAVTRRIQDVVAQSANVTVLRSATATAFVRSCEGTFLGVSVVVGKGAAQVRFLCALKCECV